MRKCILFATTGVIIFAAGLACAQVAKTPRILQPTPVYPDPSTVGFTAVNQLRATPSTIPFVANNPGGQIAGGSLATVTWAISQGRNGHTWSLLVGTGSSSFSGCTTVPVSAVSLKCVSASADGSGQSSAACNLSNFTTLPNTLPGLPLASGNEGNASQHNYTVVLSYELLDSWRYIANLCPLTVSYTVLTQ